MIFSMATDPIKAALAGYGSPRIPMGDSALKFNDPSSSPERGVVAPKRNNQSGDVGGAGTKQNKAATRSGPQFRITAKMPPVEHEAAATQANGKIIPPTHRRGKNFWSQAL